MRDSLPSHLLAAPAHEQRSGNRRSFPLQIRALVRHQSEERVFVRAHHFTATFGGLHRFVTLLDTEQGGQPLPLRVCQEAGSGVQGPPR